MNLRVMRIEGIKVRVWMRCRGFGDYFFNLKATKPLKTIIYTCIYG